MTGHVRGKALLAAVVVAASLVLASVVAGANPDTKPDATGDALGEGADITSVTVSNDAAGTISFRVATPNHATLQLTENIQLYIDSDNNTTTGSNGYEYRIHVFGGSTPPVGISRWSGSEWVGVTPSSFSGSFNAGLSVSIAKGDLGVSNAFAYAVITVDGKTGQLSDRAPDGALGQRWSYTLSNPEVDTDRDGVFDSKDGCPRTPAGKFDTNKNGCPGPYAAISARVSYTYLLQAGLVKFMTFVVKGAPKSSRVVLKAPGVTETLGSTGRPVKSSKLVKKRFRVGATITVTVTKPGMVGYVGRFEANASGLQLRSRTCTQPPIGAKPISCRRVNRGK